MHDQRQPEQTRQIEELHQLIRVIAHDVNAAIGLIWHHLHNVKKGAAGEDAALIDEISGIRDETGVIAEKMKQLVEGAARHLTSDK